ncbi:MAG: HAD family hydrolase [Streptosporangiaceae bacterium]
MRTAGPIGFDLDLTLINSRSAIMAAWAAVASEFGVRIDLDDVDQRMGIKLEDEVTYWFPATAQEQATASYRRHYIRLAPALTTLLPGAEAALAVVRAAGERAVVITAKHPVSVRPSLAAVGLEPDDLFAHVHGPEKAAVLVRIGAVAYVGDTPADMTAAQTAGAVAVGVPTGSFSAGQLQDSGAQVMLASLLDFPAWYAGFHGGITEGSWPDAY